MQRPEGMVGEDQRAGVTGFISRAFWPRLKPVILRSVAVSHGFACMIFVPYAAGMVKSGLSEMCTFYPERVTVVGISRDRGSSWAPHP